MSQSILVYTKLQDNNNYFPTKNSKLIYVFRYITRDIYSYLKPRFKDDCPTLFYIV